MVRVDRPVKGIFGVPKLKVSVLDKRKKPLMPCSRYRAHLLLRRGRAVVDKMRAGPDPREPAPCRRGRGQHEPRGGEPRGTMRLTPARRRAKVQASALSGGNC
ncbi:MAG: RRXRR domain-containing protein, partial [Bradyrhizobiaceae bacterium]|nr:RRXRR domain-containing protein [Bradyrhizobiaceae bacterium]